LTAEFGPDVQELSVYPGTKCCMGSCARRFWTADLHGIESAQIQHEDFDIILFTTVAFGPRTVRSTPADLESFQDCQSQGGAISQAQRHLGSSLWQDIAYTG